MELTLTGGETVTIDRPEGRDINPDVWAMPTEQLRWIEKPAIGWRMDVVYYDDSGVRAVGNFRPEHVPASPFAGRWATCAAQAECHTGRRGHIRGTQYIPGFHTHPHPDCSCGLRLVEHVGQISQYVRQKGAQFLSEWSRTDEPVKHALCISSVVGQGLTCRGGELDPEGTLRIEWLALDEYLIFGQEDAHVADMFQGTGMEVTVVPDLGDITTHDQQNHDHSTRITTTPKGN